MMNAQTKQPRGLYLLFFTELWERFGFYTLQTLIILYMTKELLFSDKHAYLLYGAFSSMLYLTPVIGGYLADRYLGFQKAILFGAILFVVGYLLTAYPGHHFFFMGLSTIIVANGLFKPNVSSLVGDLYQQGDPRRDGGFTIFYMGINLGSLLPPLITGSIVLALGWHAGFLLAACGMIIGLVTFILGRRKLRALGGMPLSSPLHTRKGAWTFYTLLCVGGLIVIGLFRLLFEFPIQTDLILIVAAALILTVVILLIMKEKLEQRNKLIACLILIFISIGFWAFYNQTFTSLMLYADRSVDKTLFGFTLNTEFTQFFNPFFILMLSPVLSRFWIWLDRKRQNPSTPMKFSVGILMMSVGFFVLGIGGYFFSNAGYISIKWLISSYFLQTIGELFLSPIGLAMITTLSPKHLVGMMMGVWFLTQSAAFAIGGGLATISAIPDGVSAVGALTIYNHAFVIYGTLSAVLGVLSMLFVPYVKKLIHGTDRMNPIK